MKSTTSLRVKAVLLSLSLATTIVATGCTPASQAPTQNTPPKPSASDTETPGTVTTPDNPIQNTPSYDKTELSNEDISAIRSELAKISLGESLAPETFTTMPFTSDDSLLGSWKIDMDRTMELIGEESSSEIAVSSLLNGNFIFEENGDAYAIIELGSFKLAIKEKYNVVSDNIVGLITNDTEETDPEISYMKYIIKDNAMLATREYGVDLETPETSEFMLLNRVEPINLDDYIVVESQNDLTEEQANELFAALIEAMTEIIGDDFGSMEYDYVDPETVLADVSVDLSVIDNTIKSDANDLRAFFAAPGSVSEKTYYEDITDTVADYTFGKAIDPIALTYPNIVNGTVGKTLDSIFGDDADYLLSDNIYSGELSRSFDFSVYKDDASSYHTVVIHGAGAALEDIDINFRESEMTREESIAKVVETVRTLAGDNAGALVAKAAAGEIELDYDSCVAASFGYVNVSYDEYESDDGIELTVRLYNATNTIKPTVTEYFVNGRNALDKEFYSNTKLSTLHLTEDYQVSSIHVEFGEIINVDFETDAYDRIGLSFYDEDNTGLSLSISRDTVEEIVNYIKEVCGEYADKIPVFFADDAVQTILDNIDPDFGYSTYEDNYSFSVYQSFDGGYDCFINISEI